MNPLRSLYHGDFSTQRLVVRRRPSGAPLTASRFHDKLYMCITHKVVLRMKNEMSRVRFLPYTVQIKNKLVFKNNRQILELKRDFMLSSTAKFISVSDKEMKRSYIAQLSHFFIGSILLIQQVLRIFLQISSLRERNITRIFL